MNIRIDAVLTGIVRPFKDGAAPGAISSAISKSPVDGAVAIHPLGLTGDEQADLAHHGGADKAIHHYPSDHYGYWRSQLGDHPLLDQPGAFGENIATNGISEADVCLGDRLRLGTALVEISQGRQPCWKLDHRFAAKGVMAAVVSTGRSGWYYRVLEPGQVAVGDRLMLVDRPYRDWPLTRLFTLLIGGRGKTDPAALADLARIPVLAQSWQRRVTQLMA